MVVVETPFNIEQQICFCEDKHMYLLEYLLVNYNKSRYCYVRYKNLTSTDLNFPVLQCSSTTQFLREYDQICDNMHLLFFTSESIKMLQKLQLIWTKITMIRAPDKKGEQGDCCCCCCIVVLRPW